MSRAAFVAATLAYLLIVLGALVRSTSSGLSCPDWPTCYGHWLLTPAEFAALPYTGYTYGQVMLEWVHRLIAGVLLGPLVLALAAVSWGVRRRDPALPRAALVLVALLLVQGLLGALTVLDRNSPWSVALHLTNALLVLATLLWLAWRPRPIAACGAPGVLVPLAALSLVLALAAMATAAVMAKSGASLACSDWPLCQGTAWPALSDPAVAIHIAHRVLALLLALLVVATALVAWRAKALRVRRLGSLALVLVLLQVVLGVPLVLLQIPTVLAVTHQALGVLVFAAVASLLWSALAAVPAARPVLTHPIRIDDELALQRG